jgi:hypothetical protein
LQLRLGMGSAASSEERQRAERSLTRGNFTLRTVARCDCYGGYSGEHCADAPCTSELCHGNGLCAMRSGAPICSCAAGYTGNHCEKDSCYGFECNGHGTCRVTQNRGSCECSDGYSGLHCEEQVRAPLTARHSALALRTYIYLPTCLPDSRSGVCGGGQLDPCSLASCSSQGQCVWDSAAGVQSCSCAVGYRSASQPASQPASALHVPTRRPYRPMVVSSPIHS